MFGRPGYETNAHLPPVIHELHEKDLHYQGWEIGVRERRVQRERRFMYS